MRARNRPHMALISGFAPWGFGHYMSNYDNYEHARHTSYLLGPRRRFVCDRLRQRFRAFRRFSKPVVACGCVLVREAFCFMCQHRCLRICLGVFGFLVATSSYGSRGPSGNRHAAFASLPGRSLTLVRASQLRGVPRPLSFVLPKQQREGSKTSPDILREYVFPEGHADLREFHAKSR